jgi:hypothetical protein
MLLCALAAREHAGTRSAKFVCELSVDSRDGVCDSFLSSHVCSEKGGVRSCFVAVSWTQAKFVLGDTSETKRDK